ncbi:hypothetical protein [Microbacterium sp. 4-7]|uniref:hypothetical protein n=1 Tax=Microbacterium sp. 4-7 TaxID=1885327 RepID=UPI00164F26C6|nr:hypothetical protein [Microbacterium sp. 4-7]
MYSAEWKAERAQAVTQKVAAATSVTSKELWGLAFPELFGEVELDLAQHHLIPDLDRALDTHTWHFVRSAVERLLHIDGSWLRKAVDDVRRRRAGLQADHDREAGLQPGSG